MISNKIFRLSEARELRGLSVQDLADKLNVTRQTIYKYESSTIAPPYETALQIEEILDFPHSFFTASRCTPLLESESIFYRDLKTTQAKYRRMTHRWLQIFCDILDLCGKYLDLPAVNIPNFEIENVFSLTDEEIDVYAEKTRRFWSLGDGPISNLTLLLENNGFVFTSHRIDSDKLDACSVIWQGRPCIMVNDIKQTCARDLANKAHELGHIVLHQNAELTENEASNQEKLEQQAWRFASSFLMPPGAFLQELGYPTLDRFLQLKKRWRCSISSMIMHSKELGIINTERYQYFFRELSRKGWRKSEPYDNELSLESSSVIYDCIEMLDQEGIFSKNQFLEEIRIPATDLCQLISAPKDYFAPRVVRPKLRLV